MAPKLRAHVTEGILSTYAKFHSNRLKIMHRRSVIWFLMIESVLGNEIHARMYVKYGAEFYHKINCEPMGIGIQGRANEYD